MVYSKLEFDVLIVIFHIPGVTFTVKVKLLFNFTLLSIRDISDSSRTNSSSAEE